MEGIIKIEDYKIHCILGTHAYERQDDQEIALDIELGVDITECVQTDSIIDTIDYSKVIQVCRDLAQQRRFHLLETLAYEMIHALKEAFSPLSIRLRVKKRGALALAQAVVVEVELKTHLT
jgi:7,8-dihydroneopterin aldolase/epimerase/oxygenase